MFGRKKRIVSIASVYLIIAQCSSGEIDPHKAEIIDTNEVLEMKDHKLSLSENQWNAFKRDAKKLKDDTRKEAERNVEKLKDNARYEGMQMNAPGYFRCAIYEIEDKLQFGGKGYQTLVDNFSSDKRLQQQYLYELPADIQSISNTRDLWVYRRNPKNFKESRKPGDVGTLTFYFRQWCYLLKTEENEHITFKNLKCLLEEYYNLNKLTRPFKHLNEVHQLFAAHMARSFMMACTFHHSILRKLNDEINSNETRVFSDIFFDFVPTWYFLEEQLNFLNIWKQALTGKQSRRIQGWATRNKYDVDDIEGDVTYIPYYIAKKCLWPSTATASTKYIMI